MSLLAASLSAVAAVSAPPVPAAGCLLLVANSPFSFECTKTGCTLPQTCDLGTDTSSIPNFKIYFCQCDAGSTVECSGVTEKCQSVVLEDPQGIQVTFCLDCSCNDMDDVEYEGDKPKDCTRDTSYTATLENRCTCPLPVKEE